jgi:hypothetical protein
MTNPRHDRLLSALIAKLPADAAQWPRAGRIAWLQMMAMAFEVVYGPSGAIRVADDAARDEGFGAGDHGGGRRTIAPLHGSAEHHAAPRPAPSVAQRFYVDRDGFAMGDGRPIAMEELPAGAILWDERFGIECGDASAILWRDVGTSRRNLPPSITLRPMFDES